MKKTTVDIRIGQPGGRQHTETLSGWQTDTPGLIAAKYNPNPDKKSDARWMLFSSDGYHVRSFHKRDQAAEFARLLGTSEADWTEKNEAQWQAFIAVRPRPSELHSGSTSHQPVQ